MDRVTISLQNKELIENIINSSDELKVNIPNSIMDAVTKRITKAVMNSDIVNSAVQDAIEDAEEKLKKDFLVEKKSPWGYSTHYELNEKVQKAITNTVQDIFKNKIEEEIEKRTADVTDYWTKKLQEEFDCINGRLKKYDEKYLDDLIKETVLKVVEKRFGGK